MWKLGASVMLAQNLLQPQRFCGRAGLAWGQGLGHYKGSLPTALRLQVP